MNKDHWRRCFVRGQWAYFADSDPVDVWGDDWGDSPCCHNAGPPYDDHKILKVAYDGDAYPHSADDHSAKAINAGMYPWLEVRYGKEYRSLSAGVTLKEFQEFIKSTGGNVYFAETVSETNAWEDPNDPRNGPKYHTGKECCEPGCTRPAGTWWSPYWCFQCNAERMSRSDRQINNSADWFVDI